jgi:hypothetical protein
MIRFAQDASSTNLKADANENFNGNGEEQPFL